MISKIDKQLTFNSSTLIDQWNEISNIAIRKKEKKFIIIRILTFDKETLNITRYYYYYNVLRFQGSRRNTLNSREKGRERERDIIVSVSVEIGSYTLNVVREGGVSFFATVLSFVIKCQASSSLKNPSLLCNMRKVRALRRPRNKWEKVA